MTKAPKGTPEQFDPRVDEVRQELDKKIESKVSSQSVCWTFGVLITVLLFIGGYLLTWILSTNDRLARIETTINITKSK